MHTVYQTCLKCRTEKVHNWTAPLKLTCKTCGRSSSVLDSTPTEKPLDFRSDPDWLADNTAKTIPSTRQPATKKVNEIQMPAAFANLFKAARP